MKYDREAFAEKHRGIPRTTEGAEILFTCPLCEAHYSVNHLPQPVTECPVCFYKPKTK